MKATSKSEDNVLDSKITALLAVKQQLDSQKEEKASKYEDNSQNVAAPLRG